MIRTMSAEKAIIISTHILEEVDAVCTRAVIIASGAIVANGTPAELKAQNPSGRLDEVFRKLTLTEEEKTRHVRS
jgi:ABC-2 type transport system ATP-binding protein